MSVIHHLNDDFFFFSITTAVILGDRTLANWSEGGTDFDYPLVGGDVQFEGPSLPITGRHGEALMPVEPVGTYVLLWD